MDRAVWMHWIRLRRVPIWKGAAPQIWNHEMKKIKVKSESDPIRWDPNTKQFVSRRVGEILETTEVENWRWVPTANNAADDSTRDNKPAELHSTSRWLCCPIFLKDPCEKWPQERQQHNSTDSDQEKKKIKVKSDQLIQQT